MSVCICKEKSDAYSERGRRLGEKGEPKKEFIMGSLGKKF